ncbi:MAG: hypothetical protein OWU84_07985 [Firmicutes bacterium]|nr:hypothetical protein [Bacillota bacterium]
MESWASLRRRWAALPAGLALAVTTPSLSHAAAVATKELLDPLRSPTDRLACHWEVDPESPGIILHPLKDGQAGPVAFWGTPSGYELEGLIYALERLAFGPSQPTPFSPASEEAIRQIAGPLAVDLYVAPT